VALTDLVGHSESRLLFAFALSFQRCQTTRLTGQRSHREHIMKKTILLAATLAASMGAAAQGQVNIICSVQADWCNMMSTVYSRTTGTKVNMSMKGSGEALAQLNAEKANPKTDIWFGGTGDPHLQAAEQGLTLEYKSEQLQAAATPGREAGSRTPIPHGGRVPGPVGFGFNTELLARKKAQGACVVGRPAQARVQGRGADGQPGVQRHGVHRDRHAGADHGRGQGLRLHEEAAQERQHLHAQRARRRSRPQRGAKPWSRSALCTT
jgi:hypothetical protein